MKWFIHNNYAYIIKNELRFETVLPDGLDTLADVVENVAALNATAGGEETADDPGNVLADVELLRIIYTDALHAEAETSDARKDHRLTLPQFLFQDVLQFRHHADD